ncbi:MAG: 30S ribosomal protein S21 [Calditrichaeota bacterium]|nr:30S ribosomal protein S21 [candidate division KSB1 bacterium]MCZ6820117.1 30S ribosomal protein S21 [Calditrichota bacterium]
MVIITVRDGESIDRALRRFKQRCQRAGIHRDVKRASFYLKPSEKKKLAKSLAKKRQKRFMSQ